MQSSESPNSDECLKPVKAFLRKHSVLVGGVAFGLVVLSLWLVWALYGAPYAVGLMCSISQGECQFLAKLGQVGDLFGGVNALFAALAFVAVAISTYQAFRTYRQDRQLEQDEILVDQVKSTYEWAYKALFENGRRPKSEDAVWSTAARHLLRAKAIAAMVETKMYRLIAAEHKEYWRRQFSTAFKFPDESGKDAQYLADYFGFDEFDIDLGTEVRYSRINHGAVKVVISFSQWDESTVDPLNHISEEDIVNWNKGIVGAAFRRHLRYVESSKKRVAKASESVIEQENQN